MNPQSLCFCVTVVKPPPTMIQGLPQSLFIIERRSLGCCRLLIFFKAFYNKTETSWCPLRVSQRPQWLKSSKWPPLVLSWDVSPLIRHKPSLLPLFLWHQLHKPHRTLLKTAGQLEETWKRWKPYYRIVLSHTSNQLTAVCIDKKIKIKNLRDTHLLPPKAKWKWIWTMLCESGGRTGTGTLNWSSLG